MNKFEVSIERNGKKYIGSATINNKTLTVTSITLGSKSASTSANNEFLAELLLNELIDDKERVKDI